MTLYKNTKCPVCNEFFKDGDDIVTCHVCGTPHHRKCYKLNNHCSNEELHKDNFSFLQNKKEAEKESVEEQISAALQQAVQKAEAKAPVLEQIDGKTFEKKDEIDGVAVSDIADFVRINTEKFISKFKKRKKISWNWSGFFFGPYYLFFRKMFRQGFLFIALNLICQLVVQTIYSSEINSFYNKFSEIFNSKNVEAMTAFATSPEYTKVLPAISIIAAAGLAINIIIALFANSFYKKKAVDTIKMIDVKLEEMKTDDTINMLPRYSEFGSKEGRRMYINSVGGVSVLAPIFAYLLLDLVNMFISGLAG